MDQRLSAKMRDRMDRILRSTNLFTLSSKLNSRLNLALLKHLVMEEGMKGIYVSLERPSYYVQKMLKAKGVDLESITFLDAIQKVSGEGDAPTSMCTRVIQNPFAREIVDNICGRGSGLLDDGNIDFILVDSLSVLACYVDDTSLPRILDDLKDREGVTILMLVDRECNDDLYTRVKPYFKNEVVLGDDLSVEIVS